MKALHFFLSVFIWLIWALATILFTFIAAGIWLFTLPFDKRGIILHMASSFWGYMYALINPFWSIQISGRDKIKNDRAYILIANHQSLADIPILFGLFRNFKWVSKIQNFRIPFLGIVMRMNRYIEVDRLKGRSYLKMLRKCKQEIAKGNSVLIFPEGTRSPDGTMHHFKEGAFRLAIENRTPIIPILIDGTYEALPKKGMVFRKRVKIRVWVLDPVPPASWKTNDPKELMQYFRQFMESELIHRTGKQ